VKGSLFVLLDISIGLAMGALAWWLIYFLTGGSFAVSLALRGDDPDGFDKLLASMAIGGFSGFVVGVPHAIASQF
jgi:hypothetical protein